MNQQLAINKEYWLKRNPNIEFRRVKKAYYGTHLLKAKLQVAGSAVRYYQENIPIVERVKNPTYDQYVMFLKRHAMRFGMQKLVKTEENRYIHVERSAVDIYGNDVPSKGQIRIYEVKILYTLYKMLKCKPHGIRFSREYDTLHVYSNNIDHLIEVIDELDVLPRHIKSITSPHENEIPLLLAGKEFNSKADKFKYKVFLKSATVGGLPDLANYLESIKETGEVELPLHCKIAIGGPIERGGWAYTQRSYLYVKNQDTILLIKLLAGNRYSNCVELILPTERN